MLRTITIALGLAAAASAVSAEEFMTHLANTGNELGSTASISTVTPVSDASADLLAVNSLPGFAHLPETVQRAILNARGELPGHVSVAPFN